MPVGASRIPKRQLILKIMEYSHVIKMLLGYREKYQSFVTGTPYDISTAAGHTENPASHPVRK